MVTLSVDRYSFHFVLLVKVVASRVRRPDLGAHFFFDFTVTVSQRVYLPSKIKAN